MQLERMAREQAALLRQVGDVLGLLSIAGRCSRPASAMHTPATQDLQSVLTETAQLASAMGSLQRGLSDISSTLDRLTRA